MLALKCGGKRSKQHDESGTYTRKGGMHLVSRALRHQGLWLTLTYLGLIVLMARAYA